MEDDQLAPQTIRPEVLSSQRPGESDSPQTATAPKRKRGRPTKTSNRIQTKSDLPDAPSKRAQRQRIKDAQLTGDDLIWRRTNNSDRSRKSQVLSALRKTAEFQAASPDRQQAMLEEKTSALEKHRKAKGQSTEAKAPDLIDNFDDYIVPSTDDENSECDPDDRYTISTAALANDDGDIRANSGAEDLEIVSRKSLNILTVDGLKSYAKLEDVPLHGAKSKKDIISAILKGVGNKSDGEPMSDDEDGSLKEDDQERADMEEDDNAKEDGMEGGEASDEDDMEGDEGSEEDGMDEVDEMQEADSLQGEDDEDFEPEYLDRPNTLGFSRQKRERLAFHIPQVGMLGRLVREAGAAQRKYEATGQQKHKERMIRKQRLVQEFEKHLEEEQARSSAFTVPVLKDDSVNDADDETTQPVA